LEKQIMNQAEYACNLKIEDLSREIIHQAERIILDSIGCIYLGSKKHIETEQCVENESFVWTNYMIDTELYEGNRFAIGHPACHILPLMLAVSREKEITWGKFLATFVAAYEIAARWGSSIAMPNYILGHGTVMTAAAAVAYALLDGADEETVYRTILLANSLPNVSVWQSVYDGSNLHNAYAGIGSMIAIKAYEMAQNGFYSTEEIIEQVYGKVYQANLKTEKLDEKLGTEYRICKNYFKIHTGCRFIHMFADLVKEEMRAGLQAQEIDHIDLFTYKKASQVADQNASNAMAIKFSTPVSIAILLLTGELSPDHVDAYQKSEEVRKLAQRISLTESDTYNALLPNTRGGRMVVYKKDQTVIDREVFHADGDFDCPVPYTDERLISKFQKNVSDSHVSADSGKLVTMILTTDSLTKEMPVSQVLAEFYTTIP